MRLRPEGVRPVPLKAAAVIGAALGMLFVLTSFETGRSPLFWATIIFATSAVAWFADQFEGRRGAVAAGLTFFVLGVLSPMPVALFFLVAAILCYLSFVDLERGRTE